MPTKYVQDNILDLGENVPYSLSQSRRHGFVVQIGRILYVLSCWASLGSEEADCG
jgi:hypothetical protein